MSNNSLVVANTQQLDIMKLGEVLSKSGYFQDARQANQAVVKVLAGQELGFGPIASMTGINIIKGRVFLSANLIAAAIKRSGVYNYRIKQLDDQVCKLVFYEGGQEVGPSVFTIEDAKNAKLGGDNWQKYPRNMLYARAISNGAKWYCPDIFGGSVYTPDELGADIDGETGEVMSPTIEQQDSKIFNEPSPRPKPNDSGKRTRAINSPELLLDAVNSPKKANGYYSHTNHLQIAIRKALGEPEWDWPPEWDFDKWAEAGAIATEYAEGQIATAEPEDPDGN